MDSAIMLVNINNVISMINDKASPYNVSCALQKIADELRAQIRMETAKNISTSTAKITKLMEKILKENRRDAQYREGLHYAWIDNHDGMQYVMNLYRIFRFTDHIPMEPAPDNFQPVNAKRFFDDAFSYDEFDTVELPSAAELKAYIKVNKATRGRNWNCIYDFGCNKPAVNANYLMEIVSVFPDMVEMTFKKRNVNTVLYGHSKHGEVVLQPVRKMTSEKNREHE